MSTLNITALSSFLVCWLGYQPLLHSLAHHRGGVINTDMQAIRMAWMRNMAARDNRFLDGQLLGHTLSSASFFASSNLLLIAALVGGLFGGEHTFRSAASLVGVQTSSRLLFEGQLALVLLTLARGLLEFTWSIRQMNYCLASFGAAPLSATPEQQRAYGDIAARLLNPALSSFSQGVRAYYFALAAAAWLFGPVACMAATFCVVVVLLWRQRSSAAATAVADLRKLLDG